MKRPPFWSAIAGTIALATVAVHAATVTIEPDDYTGFIAGGPGARLYTLRQNAAGDGISFQRVYAVAGGSWNPTGRAVFGHSVLSPGELAYHWDNIGSAGGAWDCYTNQNCVSFKVLGAYFSEPAQTVKILTTMRGEQAMDPVDFWAFNTDGQRIQQCRLDGVTNEVLQTGVLPPPKLLNTAAKVACGQVLEKKNCSGDPGNCDYVVEMRLQRRAADIGFAWFGGLLYQNTHANADHLTYVVP